MNYQELLTQADALEVREAVDLLLGMKPTPRDDPDSAQAKDLRDLACRAVDAGVLPCIGKKKDRLVAPRDFASWAVGKGYDLPAAWRDNGLADEVEAMGKTPARAKPPKQENAASKKCDLGNPKADANLLRMVGALVSLLVGKTPSNIPNSAFHTQTAVIAALLDRYPHTPGLSPRNLEKVFAEANRALKDA